MKEFLKKIRVHAVLIALMFLVYTGKLVVLGASFPDALVIAVLAGLYGYKMRLQLSEPKPVEDNIRKDVEAIKQALSKVNIAKITEPKKYF